MIVPLLIALAVAILVPHLLPLDRTSPATASSIWLSTMTLRALAALLMAAAIPLYLPDTALFATFSRWCWELAAPLGASQLGLTAGALGSLLLVAPSVAVGLSWAVELYALWRGAHRVQRLLTRAVGDGPGGSIVLPDAQVHVAAAGLRHPRIVVSAGALMTFDDEELAASLAHEHGHILRGHRFALAYAQLCRAAGRFIPGTRRASRELALHLERDADRYAVGQRHTPAALATAICKAAHAQLAPRSATTTALAGSNIARRVRTLLDDAPPASPVGSHLVSVALILLGFCVLSVLPGEAHAAWHHAGPGSLASHGLT